MTKVRIELEEVAGCVQRNSIRVWQDGKELTDGLVKGITLVNLARDIVEHI